MKPSSLPSWTLRKSAMLCALPMALAFAAPAEAAVDLDGEDFRIYCGYLDALEEPAVQKLKNTKAKDQKIAKMAKMSVKELKSRVEKAAPFGATCEEIGKKVEADAKKGIEKALPKRIHLFVLDYSDPSHVVAAVTWRGIAKDKLMEEAATLARTLSDEAKIVRTIAIRGIDPRARDKDADEATWFEAKISANRAKRIEKDKISRFAKTRYRRLFDGIVEK